MGRSVSPRWCEKCQAWGDRHTDRHPAELSQIASVVALGAAVIVWAIFCTLVFIMAAYVIFRTGTSP